MLMDVFCPLRVFCSQSAESTRPVPDVLLVKREGEEGNACLCRSTINPATEFAGRTVTFLLNMEDNASLIWFHLKMKNKLAIAEAAQI